MKKRRIVWSMFLLVFALGSQASQFAQETTRAEAPDRERRANMASLVRQLGTIEVTDFSQYGSYESWQTLRERHLTDLNAWLARFYYSREANVHFGDTPEILPGWNLRLNLNADGQGYVLLLEDSTDKTGYALLLDERAVIRECKYLGN